MIECQGRVYKLKSNLWLLEATELCVIKRKEREYHPLACDFPISRYEGKSIYTP